MIHAAYATGHVENGETLEETAVREVEEEVGITLTDVKVTSFINCYREDSKYHYIVPFLEGFCPNSMEPRNMEPHKCEGWQWVKWDNNDSFPTPLFDSLEDIRNSGYSPFAVEHDKNNKPPSNKSNCYFCYA